jgi:chorismate synthase
MGKQPQFEIGTQFIRRAGKYRKRRVIETVIDILTTTDSRGEVVEILYLVTHDFLGQPVADRVVATTIAMGEIVSTPASKGVEI